MNVAINYPSPMGLFSATSDLIQHRKYHSDQQQD
jgi:hypothetical protein